MGSVTPAPRPVPAAPASAEAFFVREGERLLPTGFTRGPWSPLSMHGGPPSALLVTEALAQQPRPGTRMARASVEILEPVPLVPPLARLMAVADCGNGISCSLDFERWMFVNPDLMVHLVREPVGEWICLAARTHLSPDGLGLAESAVSDESGYLGRGVQSLFVDRRSG